MYRGKRMLDIAMVAVAAVPAAAIGLGCAVAVRLSGPGPVLFRQTRVGHNGKPFELLKFRTMTIGDNPIVPDDSVITPVGRVLRRFSLDELPQLVNVARGEMSVVGPRPTLPYQVERYSPRERGRLTVRPGLTGWAQVNGRNSLAWEQRIDLDLDYVAKQNLSLDLRIAARTAKVVLSGHGVHGHDVTDPLVARP